MVRDGLDRKGGLARSRRSPGLGRAEVGRLGRDKGGRFEPTVRGSTNRVGLNPNRWEGITNGSCGRGGAGGGWAEDQEGGAADGWSGWSERRRQWQQRAAATIDGGGKWWAADGGLKWGLSCHNFLPLSSSSSPPYPSPPPRPPIRASPPAYPPDRSLAGAAWLRPARSPAFVGEGTSLIRARPFLSLLVRDILILNDSAVFVSFSSPVLCSSPPSRWWFGIGISTILMPFRFNINFQSSSHVKLLRTSHSSSTFVMLAALGILVLSGLLLLAACPSSGSEDSQQLGP